VYAICREYSERLTRWCADLYRASPSSGVYGSPDYRKCNPMPLPGWVWKTVGLSAIQEMMPQEKDGERSQKIKTSTPQFFMMSTPKLGFASCCW